MGRLALPGGGGANGAVKGVFPPAASVSGRDKPLMLKPVPEALAAERVTLAGPGVVNVKGLDPLVPPKKVPKTTIAGMGVRCAWVSRSPPANVLVGVEGSACGGV